MDGCFPQYFFIPEVCFDVNRTLAQLRISKPSRAIHIDKPCSVGSCKMYVFFVNSFLVVAHSRNTGEEGNYFLDDSKFLLFDELCTIELCCYSLLSCELQVSVPKIDLVFQALVMNNISVLCQLEYG